MSILDPQAQALVEAAVASGLPPVYTLPNDQARARMRAAFIQGEPEPIAVLSDLLIPGPDGGMPVRLYHPAPGTRRPLVLFFHGGGWTVNDLDTHDRLAILLAKGSGCAVVSVDYRRAPEAKYPAQVDDAYTALTWAVSNGDLLDVDPARLCIAGDSSGGTLAAATALLARDRRGPSILQQVLLYPVTDYLDPPTQSYIERATGYSLNFDFMAWSWRNYLPEQWSRDDPYLFPLRAKDLTGLPAAVILTAEFDPLRDEGDAYADRLREAGVSVDHWHLEDQMHGFAMQTRVIDRAQEAVQAVASKIAAVLYAEGTGGS
jgi:acetyl esterase